MPRKTALIIGNSAYQDPALAQLKAPDADVRVLTELLSRPDMGQFDEVAPLVNASEAKTRLAIATFFARAKPDDMLLLYFSGHGVLDDKGRLYLAAHDTQRDLPQATAISAAFVTDAMDSSRSRRQVLILDCCHSGAFARGARSVAEAKAITAATFEGAGYGRAVLTATDATQYAWEGEAVMGSAENSVFTHCMIEGLRTGAADTNQDGEITLEELYTYIYGEVVKRTPKQTPRKWSYNQEGEFVIARNPHPLTPLVIPLPEALQASVDDLRPWVREGALLELERLMFGKSPGVAVAAHAALQKLVNDDSRRLSLAATALLARYDAERLVEDTAREAARHEALAQQAEREAAQQTAREAALAEADRLARAQAEQTAAEQADRERQEQADREAREKAKREQREQAERAAAEQAALEQAERERLEQAELEARRKAEQELATRAEAERVARALAAQAAQAQADREAREKAEREEAEKEQAARVEAERERAARVEAERATREAAAKAPAITDTQPVPALPPSAVRSAPLHAPAAPPTTGAPAAIAPSTPASAQWLPLVIIAVGWALSRGLAQAILPNDGYPDRLPWLLNWLLGGAAGGLLMGLALRRLEPRWQTRHTWQSVAGWAAAWVFGFVVIQAARQYESDLGLGIDYELLDLSLTSAVGLMGGHLLGRAWRTARPELTRQATGRLTWGWGASWLLAAVVFGLMEESSGWVVAWGLGGLAAGLTGGALTSWVADSARQQPDTPAAQPSAVRLPVLTSRQLAWQTALIALGWGLAWLAGGGGYELLHALVIAAIPGFKNLLDVVSWGLIGALGGWATLLVLRRLAPTLGGPEVRRLIGLWVATSAFSAALTLVIGNFANENNLDLPDPLPSVFSLALAGGLAGYALAQTWRRQHAGLSQPAVLQVAGAWAVAFGFNNLILAATDGLGVGGLILAGLLAGALGGAVTLRAFTRPAP